MKRITISLLLTLMIGVTTIAGCGNKASNVEQPEAQTEQNKEEAAVPEEASAVETEVQAEAAESVDTANAGSTNTETAAPTEPDELVAEFEPNGNYDKYTLVYYIVEDIDARFVATVSAMEDDSEYDVHCSIDGEEQNVTLDKDLVITADQTGNMSYDAPLIVKKAIEADHWTKIDND